MKSPTAFATLGLVLTLSMTSHSQSIRGQSTPVYERLWESDRSTRQAPSARLDGGVVLREKFGFYWETRIEPSVPKPAEGFSTSTMDSKGVIHRVMLDRSNRTYFGYDVLIDGLPDSGNYRLTFKPLVMQAGIADGLSLDRWSDWTPLAAPRFPPSLIIHVGEILKLTLLANSSTNQNISDYVSIQDLTKGGPFQFQALQERTFTYVTGTPNDITSNDVEMSMKAPQISVSGKLQETTGAQMSEVSGVFVWFYLPNRGRFILSLGPHSDQGFRKAGEVRGSTLVFYLGSESYTLSSGSRIAPGPAAFNLYVLHQPDWKPSYVFADVSTFSMGAEDRIESLLGK